MGSVQIFSDVTIIGFWDFFLLKYLLSMTSFYFYTAAAVAEIGGCFVFWAWLRLGKSVYWILPGIVFLVVFAVLLTRIEIIFAGRTFAAYGSV